MVIINSETSVGCSFRVSSSHQPSYLVLAFKKRQLECRISPRHMGSELQILQFKVAVYSVRYPIFTETMHYLLKISMLLLDRDLL
jgi:hypothetical protein